MLTNARKKQIIKEEIQKLRENTLKFTGERAPQNSVKDMIEFLKDNPYSTESEIHKGAFGFERGGWDSNKKYADMLRRGVSKGIIKRIGVREKGKKQLRFLYFLPDAPPLNEHLSKNKLVLVQHNKLKENAFQGARAAHQNRKNDRESMPDDEIDAYVASWPSRSAEIAGKYKGTLDECLKALRNINSRIEQEGPLDEDIEDAIDALTIVINKIPK